MNTTSATLAPSAPATKPRLAKFVRRVTVAIGKVTVPALTPSDSSLAYGFKYDGTKRRLFVHFRKSGNVYVYSKVGRAQFDALTAKGASFGRVFNATILDKPEFPALRIAEGKHLKS